MQVGGWREETRTQRGDQRRAQGVVEHRRQEPALDDPGGVQELLAGGKRDLDRAGLGMDLDSHPSSTAAGGGAARPSITSQNGPSRVTRPFLSETSDIPRAP